MYRLDFSPEVERTLLNQARQVNKTIRAIEEKPELEIGLELYLQAFFELDTERSVGMTMGRIPNSAVRSYAVDYDLDEEQTDALLFYVGELDSAYLKRQQKKSD